MRFQFSPAAQMTKSSRSGGHGPAGLLTTEIKAVGLPQLSRNLYKIDVHHLSVPSELIVWPGALRNAAHDGSAMNTVRVSIANIQAVTINLEWFSSRTP